MCGESAAGRLARLKFLYALSVFPCAFNDLRRKGLRSSAYTLMVLSRSKALFCAASGLVSMVKVALLE